MFHPVKMKSVAEILVSKKSWNSKVKQAGFHFLNVKKVVMQDPFCKLFHEVEPFLNSLEQAQDFPLSTHCSWCNTAQSQHKLGFFVWHVHTSTTMYSIAMMLIFQYGLSFHSIRFYFVKFGEKIS